MKKLLKKYIDLLNENSIKNFCDSNNIILNSNEINYLLNLIKNNYEDILINEDKYINELHNNINIDATNKLIILYNFYKEKYKDFLF